jgi:CRP-like cAMP-binding protein
MSAISEPSLTYQRDSLADITPP